MDNAESAEVSKPGIVSQLAILVVTTLIAFGGGWAFTSFVLGKEDASVAVESHSDDVMQAANSISKDKDHANSAEGAGKEEDESSETPVEPVTGLIEKTIDPIVTNLAAPNDTWVRVELSVLFDSEPEPEMVQAIHQDLFAYMKTVKLHQIDGPSGYLHLKSDLRSMVETRSGGKARDILIRALLFE